MDQIIPWLAFMTIGAMLAYLIVYLIGFVRSNKEDVKRAYSDESAGVPHQKE